MGLVEIDILIKHAAAQRRILWNFPAIIDANEDYIGNEFLYFCFDNKEAESCTNFIADNWP